MQQNFIVFLRMVLPFHLLIFGTLLVGCQSEPNPKGANIPPLEGVLYVRFQEPDKQFQAEAAFYSLTEKKSNKGTFLEGNITFLGKEMEAQTLAELKNKRYVIQLNMPFSADQTFKLNHYGDTSLTLPLQMAHVEDFLLPDTIVGGTSFDIVLKGERVKKNETVVLVMEGERGGVVSKNYDGPIENDKLRVLPMHLKELGSGPGEVYLVRRRIILGKEGFLTYKANLEYYSDKKTYVLSEAK